MIVMTFQLSSWQFLFSKYVPNYWCSYKNSIPVFWMYYDQFGLLKDNLFYDFGHILLAILF